jgi:hypothetical protein
MHKKMPATTTRFRPGSTGECEAQLSIFTCPWESLADDNAPGTLSRRRITRGGSTVHAAGAMAIS